MIMGAMGPVGLNMMVFFHELDRKKVPSSFYDQYVDKLLIIEAEALKWIYFNK